MRREGKDNPWLLTGRACGVAIGLVAMLPAAAGAATPVATVSASTALSGYAGAVAYSAAAPGGSGFRLMVVRNGVSAAVPIASRPTPFDADLGPGPDGSLAAVYSRCASYSSRGASSDQPSRPGRGCRIYRFDFATGKEQPLAGTHRAGASEYLPAIERDGVAYVRSVGSGIPQLVGDFAGRVPVRYESVPAAATVLSLDLSQRRVAYALRLPDRGHEGKAHEVRIDSPGRPSTLVARTSGGGLSGPQVFSPTFDGDDLFFARACFGDPGGCLHVAKAFRYDLRTKKTRGTQLTSRQTTAYTHTGGTDYELVGDCFLGDPGATCGVFALRSPLG